MRLFFAVFLHRHLKCWIWSSYAKRFRKYEESHLFPFCLFVCFFCKISSFVPILPLWKPTFYTEFHAPVLHICHDCFLHRHLKCRFRSSCIYAKRLLKNLRKIFVSLFFVCFFFPNILFVLFLVCPTILLAIQLHQSWPPKLNSRSVTSSTDSPKNICRYKLIFPNFRKYNKIK